MTHTEVRTEAKYKAAMEIVTAVGECIRELKQVPSGHLYARLMGKISIDSYNSIIEILTKAKLIKVNNHLITWIGA